ncbi:hypothetical protein OAS86_00740 [Gammaproteobacteria bacterium]|nr:hypothetical protein [Gammaproteobacteria bacterium]
MIERVLLDAHVHLYPEFDLTVALPMALDNLRLLEVKLGEADVWALLIAATPREADWPIRAQAAVTTLGGTMTAVDGGWCIEALAGQSKPLWLIAGRQYQSAEKIEVLSAFAGLDVAENLPLETLLATLDEAGAVVILPWGVGKWLGARGKLVQQTVLSPDRAQALYIGDNGGRPWGWPLGRLFSGVGNHKVYNLPGSDPLYIGSQYNKIGTSGSLISLENQESQSTSLRTVLRQTAAPLKSETRRAGWIEFIAAQLAMRSVINEQ